MYDIFLPFQQFILTHPSHPLFWYSPHIQLGISLFRRAWAASWWYIYSGVDNETFGYHVWHIFPHFFRYWDWCGTTSLSDTWYRMDAGCNGPSGESIYLTSQIYRDYTNNSTFTDVRYIFKNGCSKQTNATTRAIEKLRHSAILFWFVKLGLSVILKNTPRWFRTIK